MSAGESAITLGPPPLPTGTRAPLAGFIVDLALAIGFMLALGTLSGVAWAAWQGIAAALSGEVDVQQVLRQASQPEGVALVWMTLLATGGAAVVVYLLRARATAAERAQARTALGRASTWGWTCVAGVGVLAASSLLGWAGGLLGSEPVPTNVALIEQAYAESPAFLLLFAVLLAPAYEELLFRRVLFGRLWRAGRPWLGLALSSAVFALVHELPGVSGNDGLATLQLWLTYGLMGAGFAWVYRHTGTLWAAIGAHAINNGLACALLLAGPG